jgi:hypothetical protein
MVVAAGTNQEPVFAATETTSPKAPYSTEGIKARPQDLSVRFLGTGASGYYKDTTRRRHSSVLLDRKILIDLNKCGWEMMPKRCHPEVLFYTHSHPDHY